MSKRHPREAVGQPTVQLQGGSTSVLRGSGGVLRCGPRRVIQAQRRGVEEFQREFPELASMAPRPLGWWELDEGRGALLERDLGPPHADPLQRVAALSEAFHGRRAEPLERGESLRQLLAWLPPRGRPKPAQLLRQLRAEVRAGAALPFKPHQALLERALDQPLQVSFIRSWGHGALNRTRVLRDGFCHWRHFGPQHLLGVDLAPFVEPDARDRALTLQVLKWAWRHDPARAADALVALGVAAPRPPAWAELRAEPHPVLEPDEVARILGCTPGRLPAAQAARALARGQGLVVAGTPLHLSCSPALRPRRDAAPWRIRHRDPQRLFSLWARGVRLDAAARASLTPEEAALDIARRLRAETVFDAFCGAGGNAIALARMPWCRRVVAADNDPGRLELARHNAALYGVAQRIDFVQGDCFELWPRVQGFQACFLDPPWEAGPALAERAWRAARGRFPRGALKLPRQAPPPADAEEVQAVFGQGPIVSFTLAWWGEIRDKGP